MEEMLHYEEGGSGESDLFVLLRLLPSPPPFQSLSLCPALHHSIQTLPQHQISVVEAPHT